MKGLLVILLTTFTLTAFGQSEERILHVVDSIAIIDEPAEDEGEIAETDIETVTVVTDESKIEKFGYKDFDKVIFIITKEYFKRPEEIKKIPTFKNMEKKEGKWYLKGASSTYTGPFIDYYFNGKKYREGFVKHGLLDGQRTIYDKDGHKTVYSTFSNGKLNGEYEEYFINGQIQQKGIFEDGKEVGLWKEWYSTGVLKKQFEFKDGKAIADKESEKLNSLFIKGLKSHEEGYYKAAVKYFDKAIELDSNYCDLYFHRSRAYLYDFQFDKAVIDCDKAIEIEPLYMEAYSNRAIIRIRKYELADSRVLSRNSEVTILAGQTKTDIPQEEKDKICKDLRMGFRLGDKKDMIKDAIKQYCE